MNSKCIYTRHFSFEKVQPTSYTLIRWHRSLCFFSLFSLACVLFFVVVVKWEMYKELRFRRLVHLLHFIANIWINELMKTLPTKNLKLFLCFTCILTHIHIHIVYQKTKNTLHLSHFSSTVTRFSYWMPNDIHVNWNISICF